MPSKKENYIKKLTQNEEKYQEELREKYNPNNIFKNKNQTTIQQNQPVQDSIALVENKDSFIY